MAPFSTPWFKIADFDEVSFWLTFQNATTRSKPDKSAKLEITEVAARGLTALIPHRLCALGHHVSLRFSVRERNPLDKGKPEREISKLEITAKVAAEEKYSPEIKLSTFQFLQFDEKKWQQILDRLARSQQAASGMIKLMNE